MSNSACGEPQSLLDAPYTPREFGRGVRARRTGSADGGADHDLAQAELDGGGGAPHHAHRGGAAEVEALGEVHRPAAVLGDRRRNEQRRLGDVAGADEAVDLRRIDAGVGERVSRELGPLLDGERRRAGELALAGLLGDPDDARVSTKARHAGHRTHMVTGR